MNYLKKQFDEEADATIRSNLSTREDARIPGSDMMNARVLPEPQCDWCGDNRPVVVYAARRMSNGDPRPCWRWATCERCDRMVTNANWDAIHRRMVHRFKRIFGPRMQAEHGHVPEKIVNEAVYSSLDEFHRYAVKLEDRDVNSLIAVLPGGGKTEGPNG